MIKPIRPEEVINIPDFIIETVNKLVQKNWNGKEAIVKQADIMRIISSNDPKDDRPSRWEIFSNHWLDFENLYRSVGWIVTYYKPVYHEKGYAYFQFKKQ